MKKLLYKIQQYVAITEVEAKAFSIVVLLLFLGLGVKYAQAHWMVPELEVRPLAESFSETGPVNPDHTITAIADTTEADSIAVAVADGEEDAENDGIDLNTATALELQSLPGIGPKLADRIISYREQNGLFRQTGDLMRVKGIGSKTYARLEPLIQVASRD